MNFFKWRFGADESLEQHDRKYHPDGYKDGDSCKLRDTVNKQDTMNANSEKGDAFGIPKECMPILDRAISDLKHTSARNKDIAYSVKDGRLSMTFSPVGGRPSNDRVSPESVLESLNDGLLKYGIFIPPSNSMTSKDGTDVLTTKEPIQFAHDAGQRHRDATEKEEGTTDFLKRGPEFHEGEPSFNRSELKDLTWRIAAVRRAKSDKTDLPVPYEHDIDELMKGSGSNLSVRQASAMANRFAEALGRDDRFVRKCFEMVEDIRTH